MCAVYGMNTQLTELRNIVTVGQKILEAGLARKESRGGHFNADFVMTPKSAPYKRSRDSFKRSRSIDKAPVRGSSPPRARPVRDVIVKSQNDESRKDWSLVQWMQCKLRCLVENLEWLETFMSLWLLAQSIKWVYERALRLPCYICLWVVEFWNYPAVYHASKFREDLLVVQ